MTRSTCGSRPGKVVRLDVDQRDLVEALELLRRQHLDIEIEQLHHPQVLGPGHALHAADDGRLPRAPQQAAQRQAAGHRVGIGIVVREDQHAVGIVRK